jgi:hypothetical protein
MCERRELKTSPTGATSKRAALVCCRDWKEAMDGSAFDRLVRHIGENGSRRGLLRSAFAATVAGLGAASVLGTEDAEAKNSCKKKCKKKDSKAARKRCRKQCNKKENCFAADAFCTDSAQCCPEKTSRVCNVPVNAGASDKTCCGSNGAVCGGDDAINDDVAPFCCAGFRCSTSIEDDTAGGPGTCIPA